MLKDFDMVYVDQYGNQITERIMAEDAREAWEIFVNTHEVNTIGLSCIEL